MFLSRRVAQGLGGGLMSIGKSKAKIYVEADTGVRFDDVAGVDEAKDELREIVDLLKDPQQYGRLGGGLPKGILLVWPPGTGKTCSPRPSPGRPKCGPACQAGGYCRTGIEAEPADPPAVEAPIRV